MDFTRTGDGHAQEHMAEAVTEGEMDLSPSLNVGSIFKLRSVGQVEISDEATLEDLKTQVEYECHLIQRHQLHQLFGDLLYYFCQMLTLPALLDVCVPSAAFVRVWQLEGQRVARILRGKQHTLRFSYVRCGFDMKWCRSFDSLPDRFFPSLES